MVGPDLAKKDTRLRECIPVNKRVAVALWRPQADISVISTLVTDLNSLITGLIELVPWLTFYCLGRRLPWYQLAFTHAKYLPRFFRILLYHVVLERKVITMKTGDSQINIISG